MRALGIIGYSQPQHVIDKGIKFGGGIVEPEPAHLVCRLLPNLDLLPMPPQAIEEGQTRIILRQRAHVLGQRHDTLAGDQIPLVTEVVVIPASSPGSQSHKILSNQRRNWRGMSFVHARILPAEPPVSSRLIDPNLVADRIEALSRIGRVGETGVTRTVYSPEWVAANDLLESWMHQAGLETRRDAVGNLFGVLQGTDPGPSIMSGSHVDSQATGGKYDGALGIIAALTAIEALNRTYGQPRQTLEVVSLCEEEGSRFSSASFWGSRAILGVIKPEDIEGTRGYIDESIGDAMRAIGLDPNLIPTAKRDDIETFIELHIEQGPILEAENLPVGIVTGITGYRHYIVEVTGVANHAGAFPMALRLDPMATTARMITELIGNATTLGAPAVTTVGRLNVEPNYPAIIPERVTFMIDARHPDPDLRQELYRRHETTLDRFATESGLTITYRFNKDLGPRPCDPGVVDLLDQVATDLAIPHRRMTSGAVHDTQRFSQIAKTAMIFVQSRAGRSHTPDEFTSTEHAHLGVEVLAEGLHRLAYGAN